MLRARIRIDAKRCGQLIVLVDSIARRTCLVIAGLLQTRRRQRGQRGGPIRESDPIDLKLVAVVALIRVARGRFGVVLFLLDLDLLDRRLVVVYVRVGVVVAIRAIC